MNAGDVIGGRFELEVPAGAGGMGSVWRARDRATGEHVAVKLLRGPARDEAAILEAVAAPGVVRYVAHGDTFLAMEWLDGVDLGRALATRGIAMAEAVALAARVAAILAPLHARGIVHRDVKPSNLLLVAGDPARVTLVDFGIARAARPARATTASPQGPAPPDRAAPPDGGAEGRSTGGIAGTPAFMAPEQARGERTDARADVFALGCVLYACLTGAVPFRGDAGVLAGGALRASAIRRDVPAALDALIARMTSQAAADRPDVTAVAAALAALPAHELDAARRIRARRELDGREQRVLTVVAHGDRVVTYGGRGNLEAQTAHALAHAPPGATVRTQVGDAVHARGAAPPAAPFAGRDRELAALAGLYAEATSEASARVALVVGGAGLGKTRLVDELAAWTGAAWRAGAYPGETTAPLALVARLLRAATVGDDSAAAAHVLAALADAEAQRARGALALDTTRLRAAALALVDSPRLVVLEDLQWSDGASLAFVDALLRDARERPLLVVATARPELADLVPDLWVARGVHVERLGPVPARAMARLAPRAAADVVARAAGNPLRLRALLAGSLPDLLALVETTLDRLDADTRRALRLASVLHDPFATADLAALLGEDPAAALRTLAQHDLIRAVGDATHEFADSAVRVAVTASLSADERAAALAVAADWDIEIR